MVRAIINSRKHYRQVTLASVLSGANTQESIVIVSQTADESLAQQVGAGTVIKAVFVELWMLATSQQPSTFNVTLEKISSGGPSMSFANSVNLHQYNNKKNVLYTTQGLIGDANSNPTPVMRQWYAIPKGKQRFGLGDSLVLNISSITEDTQYCGLFIFKSYN